MCFASILKKWRKMIQYLCLRLTSPNNAFMRCHLTVTKKSYNTHNFDTYMNRILNNQPMLVRACVPVQSNQNLPCLQTHRREEDEDLARI